MWNKNFVIIALLSCFGSVLFASIESELTESLQKKSYLFPGALSTVQAIPVQTTPEGREWTCESAGKQYFIQKGRPDILGIPWKNFVAKVTIGENAKIGLAADDCLVVDDNADYTVFTKSARQKTKRAKVVTPAQSELLEAVQRADCITIVNALEHTDAKKYRNKEFIDHVLRFVWDRDYDIKAAASYVLGLLSKDKKLDAYVYRVWSEAIDEQNYQYRTKPMFAGSCLVTIKQYGVYEVAENVKKGFDVAVRMSEHNKGAMAIFRRTMDEEFFVVSGEGEFWTKDAEQERGPFRVSAGDYIASPANTHTQFRNVGDAPLKMIVITNPPFDDVIKVFPQDAVKEIHAAIGVWQFDEAINEISKKISDIGAEDKNAVRAILANQDAPYLERYYAAKLFVNDFIAEKLAIANNPAEHWALRVAVIKALANNKSGEVVQALKNLEKRTTGFVHKAIVQALK
jgi:mannose-6-phosphate isomerase-like protein (cupin superfamily)